MNIFCSGTAIFLCEYFPGCTGALAREIVKAYPLSAVTVFDLPQVIEMARKHFCQEKDAIVFQTGEAFLFLLLGCVCSSV